jgi:hypothetical protein
MNKTIFKYVLIVSAVLYLGQVEIRDRSLGSYFVTGTKGLMNWTFTELAQNPWVVKVVDPKGISKWFPFGESKKKDSFLKEARIATPISPKTEVESEEDLNNIELDETDINSESQPDDSAVMSMIE